MLNYFTFIITKTMDEVGNKVPDYENGWFVSFPNGNYKRKSLKKIRREVVEQSKINFRPPYVSNNLSLANISCSSLSKRRKK